MKIITTLISIIGFQFIAVCQTPNAPQQPASATVCALAYSEASGSIENSSSAPVKSREMLLVSLPPATQSLTVLNVEFGMTGSFTFKKDPSMTIYENQDVYIEDMLTGRVFDLKTTDSYTFNVNRRVPDRFVLHIDKMLMRYAVSLR